MIKVMQRGHGVAIDLAICLAVLLVAVIFYRLLYPGIPVLTEVRDFLYTEGMGARAFDFLIPSGSDYRPLSWAFFGWQHRQFPFDFEAVNLIQFILLGLAAAVAYVHVRQLLGNRVAAISVGMLWMVSVSAIHAAFWQATQHDKLAFIFVLSALIVSFQAIRRDRPKGVLLFAALVLVLTVAAISTKPVAFMLPGALIAQVVLFTPDRTRSGFLRSGAVIIVPVVFSILYVSGYLLKMDEGWQAHATSGGLTKNLLGYMRFVTNADYDANPWHSAPLFAVVALGWAAALWQWVRGLLIRSSSPGTDKKRFPHRNDVLVYLLAIFTGSIVVLARARHPTPFYSLLPTFAFLASIAALAMSSFSSPSKTRRRFSYVLYPGLVVGLLLVCWENVAGSSRIGQWRSMAHNLAEGYTILRDSVKPEAVQSIRFVFPAEPEGFFYFYSDGTHQTIDPLIPSFMFQRQADIEIIHTTAEAPPENPREGELVAVWSRDQQLIEASVDGSVFHHDSSIPAWPARYDPGQVLDFRGAKNGLQYLGDGWSRTEGHGTWSDGDFATLVMKQGALANEPLELRVSGQMFVVEAHPVQQVEVFANGRFIATWTMNLEERKFSRLAQVPAEMTRSRYLELRFRFLHPKSPASVNLSQDGRRLGMLLQEIELSQPARKR